MASKRKVLSLKEKVELINFAKMEKAAVKLPKSLISGRHRPV